MLTRAAAPARARGRKRERNVLASLTQAAARPRGSMMNGPSYGTSGMPHPKQLSAIVSAVESTNDAVHCAANKVLWCTYFLGHVLAGTCQILQIFVELRNL